MNSNQSEIFESATVKERWILFARPWPLVDHFSLVKRERETEKKFNHGYKHWEESGNIFLILLIFHFCFMQKKKKDQKLDGKIL